MTAIREAAVRASAEMPEGIDDKPVESCKARFLTLPPTTPFPKVADTVYVGSPPCENLAGENFRTAVRALVDKLPGNPQTLAAYFLRDELLAVRKLLGDE